MSNTWPAVHDAGAAATYSTWTSSARHLAAHFGQALQHARTEILTDSGHRRTGRLRRHHPDRERGPREDPAPAPDRLHMALHLVEHRLCDFERSGVWSERRVEERPDARVEVLAESGE